MTPSEQTIPQRLTMQIMKKLQEVDQPQLFTPRAAYDGRKNLFSDGQILRQSRFEDAQRGRHLSFKKRTTSVQQKSLQKEAERVRDLLVWKELKMWEVEKNLARWQAQFEEDEAQRNNQVARLENK